MTALTACRRLDAWSDGSLKAASQTLEPREAAFAAYLTYGVLQNRALLDFCLDALVSGPFHKLEPFVRDVLRLGAFQILFMDRVPDSAAVSEAVEMVKRHRRARSAGLVNAVLRRLSRERGGTRGEERFSDLPRESRAEYLALRYSHPKWLVERLLVLLGPEETEAYLREDNAPAGVVIQRNPLQCTRTQWEDYWREDKASLTPHPWLPDCWTLTGGGNLEARDAFQKGWFQVQDAGARIAAGIAAPEPGERALDVCAAPGGKSCAMAMEMENRGEIVACDIHPHKLELIRKNAERLGIGCIETKLVDGRENRAEWNGRFQSVLCDVPCSGLGIIRKKPDIRYKDPEALRNLPKIQREILENAGRYVAPGGVLVYVTCTVLPEENEGVSGDFLENHPEFRLESFALPGREGVTEGQITLWPQRDRTDGFYICKMRRQ